MLLKFYKFLGEIPCSEPFKSHSAALVWDKSHGCRCEWFCLCVLPSLQSLCSHLRDSLSVSNYEIEG